MLVSECVVVRVALLASVAEDVTVWVPLRERDAVIDALAEPVVVRVVERLGSAVRLLVPVGEPVIVSVLVCVGVDVPVWVDSRECDCDAETLCDSERLFVNVEVWAMESVALRVAVGVPEGTNEAECDSLTVSVPLPVGIQVLDRVELGVKVGV